MISFRCKVSSTARLQPGRTRLESPGFVTGFDDVAMMSQPIEHCRGHFGIAKDVAPLGERQVCRDHHAGMLIELRQQMEQQGPSGLAKGQTAEFVEDNQIDIEQSVGQLSGLSVGLLLLQRIDQPHCREETHALAQISDRFNANGGRQVRLAGARPADEHHVVRGIDEIATVQTTDECLIDLCLAVADKTAIAAKYGIPDWQVMESWLRALNFVRNVAAHHSRLWNKNLVDQPKLPKPGDIPEFDPLIGTPGVTSRLYVVLCMLIYFMRAICPNSSWPERLREMLGTFPAVQKLSVGDMGFPAGWEKHAFWPV